MPKVNLDDFFSDEAKIKYAATKKAIEISKNNPTELYADFDFFVKMLDNEKNVLKWTAIIVLGNLSKIDNQNKIDKILPRLIASVGDKSLITAGNSIKSLAKIAKFKPEYQKQILNGILKVEKATYYNKGKPSFECRNVVIGHALDSIGEFDKKLIERKEVLAFIKRQTKNTRPTVQKRAKKLYEQAR